MLDDYQNIIKQHRVIQEISYIMTHDLILVFFLAKYCDPTVDMEEKYLSFFLKKDKENYVTMKVQHLLDRF